MDMLPQQPTIVEQAYRAILDAICDGRLAPGERLTQDGVAQKLKVSRQPIGQALLLLKEQKFVTEAGRRGLMVAPLDRAFTSSIYELRLGLEPLAAALAAQRATPEQVEAGRVLIAKGQEGVRAASIAVLIAADMDFHMLIYEMAHNRLFTDTMRALWNHLRRAMREVLERRDYRKQVWTEHEQMLRAIAEHDAKAAAALARAHLGNAAVSVQLKLPAGVAPGS
jgi:DNA-binding GntR family transcriptional regulator